MHTSVMHICINAADCDVARQPGTIKSHLLASQNWEWCTDVVWCFIWKSDGEVHRWGAWLSCAGGRSWRPVLLLAAEPHRDRWVPLRVRVPDMFLSSEQLFRGAYITPPLGHESRSMWPEITVCTRILF